MDYKLLNISSTAFYANGIIPSKYTRLVENVNPPLNIDQITQKAKSLAIVMVERNAPEDTRTHWVLWNLPTMSQINENEVSGEQGMNDFGSLGYSGPCSPREICQYIFKVYALDDMLQLLKGACRRDLEDGLRYHTILMES